MTDITAHDGRYTRDEQGTWRYADSAIAVPGAQDMTISSLYNLRCHTDGTGQGYVEVPRSLAHNEPELTWCLDYGGPGDSTPGDGARTAHVDEDTARRILASRPLLVPVEEWDRRAQEPIGMWAPELTPDHMPHASVVRALAEAERDYRHARARLEADLERARQTRDAAIRNVLKAGLSQAQAMRATGLSRQRVSQIAAEQ